MQPKVFAWAPAGSNFFASDHGLRKTVVPNKLPLGPSVPITFFFRTITHQRESVNEYDKIWVATTTVTRVLGKSLSVLAKVIGDGCEDLFNNLKNIEK